MIEIIVTLIAIMFSLGLLLGIIMPEKEPQNEQQNEQQLEGIYMKPQFKPLTDKKIKDIHLRGKITPAEMVKEWESIDLCAPGNEIRSATWRCKKFRHCCHDCLVDYVNKYDEYTSMF